MMPISKPEAKQLLERMIFEESNSEEWVQDVWGLNPVLGESAAKLLEVFDELCDRCPDDELDNLLQVLYQKQL